MAIMTIDFATEQAISTLDAWLLARSYSAVARAGIADHIRRDGDLTDCPCLDREDLEPAVEILVAGFGDVPSDDPSWDADDDCWTPSDAIAIYPPECDDIDEPDGTPDEHITLEPDYWPAMIADGILPLPVAGGSPEPLERFEPTPQDWEDYRRDAEWRDRLEAMHDGE